MSDEGRELDGRLAVVTGAGRGIGRAIALDLAAAGASVVLAARSTDELEGVRAEVAAAGGTALAVPTDLRRPADLDALAARVARLGVADVVVANSGIAGPTGPLWELEPDAFAKTLAVNVTGTFLLLRALLPPMVARGSGSVVAVGSATGKHPLPGRTPYAASKLGLVGLVRTLAWELGPHGVRCNLVSPGPVAGPRLDDVLRAQADARGVEPAQVRGEFDARSPLGRPVAPEEVAGAVRWLASDRAAAITGEDLNVSTGWVMHG